MYKMLHGLAPSYLTSNLKYVSTCHRYNTGSSSSQKLYIPNGHKYSLYTAGANEWNKLPFEIRTANNLTSFKIQCTKYVFKNVKRF